MSAVADSSTAYLASRDMSDSTNPMVRKFKASDLPLPSATRSAIDNLAHTFKKKGGYDTIRKQLWAKFEAKVYICQTFHSYCFI